jgi:hypothetical protein
MKCQHPEVVLHPQREILISCSQHTYLLQRNKTFLPLNITLNGKFYQWSVNVFCDDRLYIDFGQMLQCSDGVTVLNTLKAWTTKLWAMPSLLVTRTCNIIFWCMTYCLKFLHFFLCSNSLITGLSGFSEAKFSYFTLPADVTLLNKINKELAYLQKYWNTKGWCQVPRLQTYYTKQH